MGVLGRKEETAEICVSSAAHLNECFPPQSRHPERSTTQAYRHNDGLWCGVEGPRRCLLADALPSFPAVSCPTRHASTVLPATSNSRRFFSGSASTRM